MADNETKLPAPLTSLSARLLVLTIFFVMVAEFLIWAPSVSQFRKAYLEEHVVRAHLSTLAFEAIPKEAIDRKLEETLLDHAEAYGIVLKGPERRALMASSDMPPKVSTVVDLRKGSFLMWIRQAFDTLVQEDNRILRVIGMSPKSPNITVEVVMDEMPMREAMYEFSRRILNLSIVISLFTAGLVYVTLRWLMVRPMQKITRSIQDFRQAPEDATRDLRPGNRTDEIGVTERELAKMQGELRHALRQQTRLATLGAAIAKINHDLRNSLATAVLAFDKLASVDDPEVKRVLPRLYNAIDKAVNLCSQTLNYASDAMPALKPDRFHLQEVIAEAAAAFREPDDEGRMLTVLNKVDFLIEMTADRTQLFRVFSNLFRNAQEAGAETITITASWESKHTIIEIVDDGPGFTMRARERLFQPFAGSSKDGGTGLGLVIVRDILKAHGGDIELLDDGEPTGVTFRIVMPRRRAQAA
ncbi:MAG: HAMP domain-containing histidine kinase [Rhodospirillaceae bacterium]|nr:HAMP domain-containing histidine kinase [Rhodospirillaceae bacterium]